MGKVVFYMTVSVDGFVAGPDDDVGRLFAWYFSGDVEIPIPGSPTLRVSPESAEVLLDATRPGGAIVTGRRNFDLTGGWGGTRPPRRASCSRIPSPMNGSPRDRRSSS